MKLGVVTTGPSCGINIRHEGFGHLQQDLRAGLISGTKDLDNVYKLGNLTNLRGSDVSRTYDIRPKNYGVCVMKLLNFI